MLNTPATIFFRKSEPLLTRFPTLGTCTEYTTIFTISLFPETSNTGHSFKLHLPHCQVQAWATCLPIYAPQYNLLPDKGRWYLTAGEVTAGLAKSNGSLPAGFMASVTCRLTVQGWDQLRSPRLVSVKEFFYPRLRNLVNSDTQV